MKKIETLTPAQEAQIPIWHADWFKAGSETAPADRPRAEAAITRMYAEIGEPAPAFVWCDSPLTCSLMLGLLQCLAANEPQAKELREALRSSLRSSLGSSLRSSLGGSLGSSLWSSLGSSLWSSLESSLWSSLRSSLESSLRSSLGGSLGSSLWSSLGSSLESSLRSSLGSSLRGSLRSSLGGSLGSSLWSSLESGGSPVVTAASYHWSRCFWGQHEAYWIAFYAFCRDVAGVTNYDERYSRVLDLWGEIARSACWWYPYKGICVVSERPEIVSWDERGLLHAQGGPALRFRDGFELHSWHGTTVPAEWITAPGAIDVATALTHQNMEQRRAAAEIVGWGRVREEMTKQGKCRVIDADPDKHIGTLYEIDLPDSPGEKFLEVRCGTGRDFTLPVDPAAKTALEANARTYRLKPNQYKKLEFRT